jgi:hypothetical protein
MDKQKDIIKLRADFNSNSKNGLHLICKGTIDDLARQKIELKDGMKLLIWDEDVDDNNIPDKLIAEAIAKYNHIEQCWEAVFEWGKVRHESDLKK